MYRPNALLYPAPLANDVLGSGGDGEVPGPLDVASLQPFFGLDSADEIPQQQAYQLDLYMNTMFANRFAPMTAPGEDLVNGGAMLNHAEYMQLSQGLSLTPRNSNIASLIHVCSTDPPRAIESLLRLQPDDLAAFAKDQTGHRFIVNHVCISPALRAKVHDAVVPFKHLAVLAIDNFGNFVIQKMLEFPDVKASLVDAILEQCLHLTFNRFGCRVVQRMVTSAPVDKVSTLLQMYAGQEGRIAKDQNGNHIVQRVLENHSPEVYGPFVMGMAQNPGVVNVSSGKYGCRVVQSCLEQLVRFCESPRHTDRDKKPAYAVLHVLMEPILRHTILLAENEFANYIVQYVLRSDFLDLQRRYIIKNSLLHNILWLSQGKYASHVLEVALKNADDELLRAMFLEILEGYEKDARGRDALDIMLFDQFGNYVVQRLLEISIAVYMNERPGDKTWLETIAKRVLYCSRNLMRYSSGKKIIETIRAVLIAEQSSLMCQPGVDFAMLMQPPML